MTLFLARLLMGLLPVLLFLGVLIYLDSYKLVSLRWILATIVLGGLVAVACYAVNVTILSRAALSPAAYSRYVAPLLEESAKAAFLVYLIRSNRVGFLVDAAIYGFAIGTGFAVVENVYYLQLLTDVPFTVWLIRGFGTALMHGGTTAIFGVIARALLEREGKSLAAAAVPGLLIGYAIHSAFNHFFLSPVLSTAGVLVGLPFLMFIVFERSEKSLESWLRMGFDADAELLEMIESGGLSESRIGRYLHSLKEKFHGEVVADLLCYLRIHVELSLRAKGLLMMRESGFRVELDEVTRAKLTELDYLERSIGKTGKLAMAPFLHGGSRKALWQLTMLGK